MSTPKSSAVLINEAYHRYLNQLKEIKKKYNLQHVVPYQQWSISDLQEEDADTTGVSEATDYYNAFLREKEKLTFNREMLDEALKHVSIGSNFVYETKCDPERPLFERVDADEEMQKINDMAEYWKFMESCHVAQFPTVTRIKLIWEFQWNNVKTTWETEITERFTVMDILRGIELMYRHFEHWAESFLYKGVVSGGYWTQEEHHVKLDIDRNPNDTVINIKMDIPGLVRI